MEPFTSHPLALPHLPLTLAVTPAHPPKAATHAVAKAAPTILLILIVANPRSFKPVIGHGFIEYGGGGGVKSFVDNATRRNRRVAGCAKIRARSRRD